MFNKRFAEVFETPTAGEPSVLWIETVRIIL